MHDKSHVSLERHVCLVCGAAFDTGNLLFDRRLRASLERYTTTGWGLCAEHRKLFDDGYVALVECDPARSGLAQGTASLQPEQAYRTGRIAHVRREAFAQLFDVPVDARQVCVFVDPEVIDRLQAMVPPAPG